MALIDWEPWVKIIQSESFWVGLGTAGIGSLAGAWGGAWAIQRIAEKARRRTILIDEIRGCNAGIDVVGSILNDFLNLKGQHLVKLKRGYEDNIGLIEVVRSGRKDGWIDRAEELNLRVDQGTLPIMRMPLERLQFVVTEKVTISGRPQGLMNKVVQSVHRANEMIEGRNNLIEEFKSYSRNEQSLHLFALPLPQGGEDHRYKDCIEGIAQYSDDVIYFSSELSRALTKHGRRTESTFRKRFGALPHRTSEMYFDTEEWRQLAPDTARFASWEGTYIELVPKTDNRRFAKWMYAVRKAWRKILLKPWWRCTRRAQFKRL